MSSLIKGRFLFLSFLASIFCTNSNAEFVNSGDWAWSSFEKSATAVTSSKKFGNELALWVWFNADAKCVPTIMYAQTQPTSAPRYQTGAFQGSFEVRIDTKNPWEVKTGVANAFYSSPRKNGTIDYIINLEVPVKFILELAYGQTFRLLRVDTGVTDRFSLFGSASAIGNAFRACERINGKSNDPDLQFFNQGQYKQAPQPQKQQDADRQFFK